MSRVGKQIIKIPAGVTVELKDNKFSVKGPKGSLERVIDPRIKLNITATEITVDVAHKDEKRERSLWGTYAAHVKNMVEGVVKVYQKKLEINGVGYKAAMQGKDVKLDVGYTHPVVYKMPESVTAVVEKNVLTLESPNKELLGQVASEIRAVRKPEPYKGKGIKYLEEVIRRKAGKTAAKTAA
ncbi:MAG TPA: 50S ribosomal protein L6 [Candidatus Magasanikbacteria bacterium]|nr:50S ribosomal protein L6 [Candidatus Magasanikbacteria bacterium]